jgi:hypothetical protein
MSKRRLGDNDGGDIRENTLALQPMNVVEEPEKGGRFSLIFSS